MLQITLKNGIAHRYPEGKLDLETVQTRLEQEFWIINSDNRTEIYRTEEIAHVTISRD